MDGRDAAFFLAHAARVAKNTGARVVFGENLERQGVHAVGRWLAVQISKGIIEEGGQDIAVFVGVIYPCP